MKSLWLVRQDCIHSMCCSYCARWVSSKQCYCKCLIQTSWRPVKVHLA